MSDRLTIQYRDFYDVPRSMEEINTGEQCKWRPVRLVTQNLVWVTRRT